MLECQLVNESNAMSNNIFRHQSTSGAPAFYERTTSALLALLALSLPLFFWLLGGWGFFDPDEGRYAEIAREMIARGNWITPTLGYTPYFEKPPLLYWLTALSFRVFGQSEWAGRLVPALAALAGLFLTYMLGRRMFGARAGFLGAVILATTVSWPMAARFLIIDMLFSVLLFGALAFWWMGHSARENDETNTRRRGYFLGFWVALALAVLAKGPVAVVLAGLVIGCYWLLCRRGSTLREMEWLPGVLLFLLITAPWFVLVAKSNPGFNHYFWYGQHIGRFLGKGDNREHVKSFTYFFVMLPLLFFPWSFFLPAAFLHGWRKIWPPNTPRRRATIYLTAAATLILLFFSASSSKLITYILPIFPPLALLLGFHFDRMPARGWSRSSWISAALLALTLLTLALVTFLVGPKELRRAEGLGAAWALWPAVLLLAWAGAVIDATLWRRERLVAAIVAGCTLFFAGAMPLLNAAAPNHQISALLNYIQPGLRADGEIVIYESYTQSVGFYTRRRVMIINNENELKFGIAQLPRAQRERWFPSGSPRAQDALRRVLSSPHPVYAVIKDHTEAQRLTRALNGEAIEIIWNKRRAIIGNRAAAAITPPQPGGWLALNAR